MGWPSPTFEPVMVVTRPGHVHAPAAAVHEQLPDLLPVNIFAEPGPRSAAIGLAAAVLAKRDPEVILVTTGIAPSSPTSSFDYIRLGEKLRVDGAPDARLVSQFKEKPDARAAAAYLSSGNAGMFVVRARVPMDLLTENEPALHAGPEEIAESWDPAWVRTLLRLKRNRRRCLIVCVERSLRLRLVMPLRSLQLQRARSPSFLPHSITALGPVSWDRMVLSSDPEMMTLHAAGNHDI